MQTFDTPPSRQFLYFSLSRLHYKWWKFIVIMPKKKYISKELRHCHKLWFSNFCNIRYFNLSLWIVLKYQRFALCTRVSLWRRLNSFQLLNKSKFKKIFHHVLYKLWTISHNLLCCKVVFDKLYLRSLSKPNIFKVSA